MRKSVYLRVKDYGPLKKGTSELPNGSLEIRKHTILIGDQGTGKSTLAKLFSTFSWLEKALVRNYYSSKAITVSDLSTLLMNQNLPWEYIKDTTEIEYIGQAYSLSLSGRKFKTNERDIDSYICPKILYVPSERNVLSVIENAWDVKGLTEMVSQLASEFLNASRRVGKRSRRLFPYYTIAFDPETRKSFVKVDSEDSVVPLTQASSGLQSIAPLVVVSDYMAKGLEEDFLDRLKKESVNIKSAALKAFDTVKSDELYTKLANYFASGLTKGFSENDIKILKEQLGKYVNSCLWEIVEEPEQNLFPLSQVEILKKLVEYTSSQDDKLVMTTHSPYILSAMNNFIFAKDQFDKYQRKVSGIPERLFIDFTDVGAYKVGNGYVKDIMDKDSRMIDVTEIDECSRDINNTFDRLLSIGE